MQPPSTHGKTSKEPLKNNTSVIHAGVELDDDGAAADGLEEIRGRLGRARRLAGRCVPAHGLFPSLSVVSQQCQSQNTRNEYENEVQSVSWDWRSLADRVSETNGDRKREEMLCWRRLRVWDAMVSNAVIAPGTDHIYKFWKSHM